jgi:hypothetical protein
MKEDSNREEGLSVVKYPSPPRDQTITKITLNGGALSNKKEAA